jgi:hypothetical protein
MNSSKTSWQAWLRQCRSFVVLALVAYGSHTFGLTEEDPLDLPNGCTVFLQQFHGPATVHKTEGHCKDGLAHGMWRIGLYRQAYNPGGTPQKVRTFRYTGFSDGKANGVHISLTDSVGRLIVDQSGLNGILFEAPNRLEINASEAEVQRFIVQVEQANRVARSLNLPTADIAQVKTILRQWRNNPGEFLESYLSGEGTTPPWENGRSVSERWNRMESSKPDDPKTVGRGARSP